MLSVFQIFKVLIGIIVFVVVMTFFLRLSEDYMGVGETGREYETAEAFDIALMNTYTSGNPGSFEDMGKFDMAVFLLPPEEKRSERAKLAFPSGQKTLSVPAFVFTSTSPMKTMRFCEGHEWYRFCYVYAYPEDGIILFTPEINNAATRKLILNTLESLPDDLEYGYCEGETAMVKKTDEEGSAKKKFMDYVMGAMQYAGNFEPCTKELKPYYRLITIGTGSPRENEVVIMPSGENSGTLRSWNGEGISQTNVVSFTHASDVSIATAGGALAVHNKRGLLLKDLLLAAKVMRDRTSMVHKMIIETNLEPCANCATVKYEKACGYTDSEGHPHTSDDTEGFYVPYEDFIDALDSLIERIESQDSNSLIMSDLGHSAEMYKVLKDLGCES